MGTDEEILRPLRSEDQLGEILDRPRAAILKHSPDCWSSFRAIGQVRRFALEHPDTPIFVVDVIGDRSLSAKLARRVGIRHASPQFIVLERGDPVWHASHGGVRYRKLSAALTP